MCNYLIFNPTSHPTEGPNANPPPLKITHAQDSFQPTVTVLEAVLFHAHMRLGVDVPLAAKLERAHEVIRLAGLTGQEDARVGGRLPGGIMVRGLSGGEKRRLSLCCGIVAAPEVLFCDEATSGGWVRGMWGEGGVCVDQKPILAYVCVHVHACAYL